MEILNISGLSKEYPSFLLENINFRIRKGRIMGLIGRNGAGKSTTIKAILNMIHPDEGKIQCFGLDMAEHEREIKQKIGFAAGAVDYYKKKKLSEIIKITKAFYEDWDDGICQSYISAFALDTGKTPSELSEGMKVKFSLLLALSHKAELIILDEPTSGLDPVSREELLDIFRILKKRGATILFSTHIISDLEKCADDITYIRSGKLLYSGDAEGFVSFGKAKNLGSDLEEIMISCEKEVWHENLAD